MATSLSLEDLPQAATPARARAIEQGLPVKMLRVLMRTYELGPAELSRMIAPRRTLERRLQSNERLTAEESDRLARLMRVLDLAESIFDDRASAVGWLSAPKRAFDEAAAFDLLKTEAGGRVVEDQLLRLKHGFFA
ncbi:DUF2384 domain-containing protein [Sphingomonas ginkgonis]|uniref:DUF2384 domain-containing protein n=1 Tax=Sphingomonas ginkgonis TaxID=2315330 RepID=A0A3R9WRV2_9SPHN|nr:antitoxin Xre-like helix-turn-helix domain-containing protein [Sphingomonas ginkgonis]RST31835.1 DUF2384 domain-containing protein [Sphingomonas ginkgonis]